MEVKNLDVKVETLAEELSLTLDTPSKRKVSLRFRFSDSGIATAFAGDYNGTEDVDTLEAMGDLIKYAAMMYRQAYAKKEEKKNE